jgi:hypothetical protein
MEGVRLPSFFFFRCNFGAKGEPKHGNSGDCGQNYSQIRVQVEFILFYLEGG